MVKKSIDKVYTNKHYMLHNASQTFINQEKPVQS